MENKTFILLVFVVVTHCIVNIYFHIDQERRIKQLYLPAIKELIHELGHMQQNLQNGIYIDNDTQEFDEPCFYYTDANSSTTLPQIQYSFTFGNEHNEKGKRCLSK